MSGGLEVHNVDDGMRRHHGGDVRPTQYHWDHCVTAKEVRLLHDKEVRRMEGTSAPLNTTGITL